MPRRWTATISRRSTTGGLQRRQWHGRCRTRPLTTGPRVPNTALWCPPIPPEIRVLQRATGLHSTPRKPSITLRRRTMPRNTSSTLRHGTKGTKVTSFSWIADCQPPVFGRRLPAVDHWRFVSVLPFFSFISYFDFFFLQLSRVAPMSCLEFPGTQPFRCEFRNRRTIYRSIVNASHKHRGRLHKA